MLLKNKPLKNKPLKLIISTKSKLNFEKNNRLTFCFENDRKLTKQTIENQLLKLYPQLNILDVNKHYSFSKGKLIVYVKIDQLVDSLSWFKE